MIIPLLYSANLLNVAWTKKRDNNDSYVQILETPSLLSEGSKGVRKNIFKEKPPQPDASASSCC